MTVSSEKVSVKDNHFQMARFIQQKTSNEAEYKFATRIIDCYYNERVVSQAELSIVEAYFKAHKGKTK